jgi:type 1 fimbria pilin
VGIRDELRSWRVDFAGRVTDISCSVALNGGNNAGSGSVWLAPVSLAEVHDRGAGAFMKPQPFTLELQTASFVMMAARRIKMKFGW